jgi:EAL domain-containing protein (putative c-di-GMP-specific phosphodiesterase class I)
MVAGPELPVGESELQRGLDSGELFRVYQPIVEVPDGEVRYVEALVRWEHYERGAIMPAEFLADERDTTALVRMGWAALIEAAQRGADWRRAFPDRSIRVSVNLVRAHVERRELATRVAHLVDVDLPGPPFLAIEISEQVMTPSLRSARDRLLPVRNLGVEIIVDDFGATAAAGDLDRTALRDATLERFESLQGFPVDLVKLDPRFVRRLGDSIADVVAAAHAVGFRVVALAVEDAADGQRARDAGFDLAQGFFYHRPSGPAYVDGLLASR